MAARKTTAKAEEPAQERLTPTSIAQWPKKFPGLELKLPSGAVARVSPPPSMYLAATGRVPPKLRKVLGKFTNEEMGRLTELLEPELLELLMDWLVAESFLDPKVSLLPREGYLCIADIDVHDRDFVARSLQLKP
jgi:hypothetical protein